MSDKVIPGPVCDNNGIREAVCIHTKKIYDSCRDRDCIEDLRFYPTLGSQSVIERASCVRSGKAYLLNVQIDVEPTSFQKGYYSVDIRYYYQVKAEAFIGACRPVEISGLCIFDKRCILCGGEGSAKIYSSECNIDALDPQNNPSSNLPTGVVEVVDPIVLNMKLVDPSECCIPCCPPPCPPPICDCQPTCAENECYEIPPCISSCFGGDLCFGNDRKRVYVTLGQFSIIRLERDSQLLIPVYDYCMPTKECACSGNNDDDPCEVFRQVQFPVDEFFPPDCPPTNDDGCCSC